MTTSENPQSKFAMISVIGEPNSGKSTLVNAILGERLCAVHAKPQMTRRNMLGIHTENNVQLAFVDTPGFHKPKSELNRAIMREFEQHFEETDAVMVLFDVNKRPGEMLLDRLKNVDKPIFVVLNKMDMINNKWKTPPEKAKELFPDAAGIFFLSAKKDQGVQEMLRALEEWAPEGPFLYDEEDMTTASLREIAENALMESLMQSLGQEVPYQIKVVVSEYKEEPSKHIVSAELVVNRESQKPVVIGKGGKTLKDIRIGAEKKLALIADSKIQFHLHVKVEPNWIKSRSKVQDYISKG